MNDHIAKKAKDLLAGIPWLERRAGLVKTLEVIDRGQAAKLVKFPITRDAVIKGEALALEHSKYEGMHPDSLYKGSSYFEHRSFKAGAVEGNFLNVTGSLRLVVYCNLAAIGKEEASIQAEVLAALIKGRLPNCGTLNAMQLRVTGIVAAEEGLFSRYTYDETTKQFLMHPYYAFGIDIEVTGRYNVHTAI